MLRAPFSVVAVTAGLLSLGAAQSNATPSNGSLLVPGDIAPGNYWATPTSRLGGYVEVCADYQCDVGGGMIENYSVDGRTMIVVPYTARMVNVDDATLTPVNAPTAGDTWSAPAPQSNASVTLPPGA